MNDRPDTEHGSPGESPETPKAVPAWKKILAVVALVAGVAGVALGGLSSAPAPDSAPAGGTGAAASSLGAQSFGAGDSGGLFDGVGDEESAPETLWAPLLAKGGLSFFIAFCIGYALRTFLKGTMLVIGVTALAVFGLQKAGILGEVDWNVAQGYWDDLTANLGKQFESLKSFVTGSLPSAASGSVGLVAGFRR